MMVDQYNTRSAHALIDWYKQQIDDIGEPQTRTDRAVLQVYTQIVEQYELRHHETRHGERRHH